MKSQKNEKRNTKEAQVFRRLDFVTFRRFNIAAIVLFMILIFTSALYAASARVRISIDNSQSYWVGQKIPFYIDLLSPGFFSGTPKFDLPEISGVLVMKIPERPVMGTEEIEGHSYTKQRHEFVLFSQRPGQIDIPAFTVRFGISSQAGAGPKEIALKTSPLTLTPNIPPGAEKLASIISTRDLEVTESWNPAPKDAVTGDAFTRTVTFQAPDTPGMAFAPITELNIYGIGIYAEAPVVNAQMERGDFVGQRTEKVTYVMESAGKMTIPSITFHWFDIASETVKTEKLPEVVFNVKAAIMRQSSGKPAMGGALNMFFVILFVLMAITVAVLWRCRSYLAAYLKSWQEIQKAGESHYFKQFSKACRNDDPHSALKTLMAWLDRVNPDLETSTLSRFTKMCGNAEMLSELDILQKTVFSMKYDSSDGKRSSWSGRKLLPLMIIARKRLSKKKYIQNTMTGGLIPLNPV